MNTDDCKVSKQSKYQYLLREAISILLLAQNRKGLTKTVYLITNRGVHN
jgi:hypothetical protein